MNDRSSFTNIDHNNFDPSQFTTMAESIFKEYSNQLEPTIFFIILQNNVEQNSQIKIIKSSLINDKIFQLDKIINYIKFILNSNSNDSTSSILDLLNDVVSKNIRNKFIECIESIHTNKILFISQPNIIKNNIIFTVLQLNKSNAESIFVPIEISGNKINFLDYLTNSFFDITYSILLKYDEFDMRIQYDDHIKRIATTNFIDKIIAIYTDNTVKQYMTKIICDQLSSLTYENKPNVGQMIICPEKHDHVELVFEFENKINMNFNMQKKIRKLLEMTSNELYLQYDGKYITKLIKINNDELIKESFITINFVGLNEWKLTVGSQIPFSIKNGKITSLTDKEIEIEFSDILLRKFPRISNENTKKLWSIIETCTKQKNGTLVVISNDCKVESDRLKNTAINIKPVYINDKLFKHLTSIDGAIMLDLDGMCYSVGMILDGNPKEYGDMSRGSRYNSAIRYINTNLKSIAIIVSEDKIVDIYPKLPKPISENVFKYHYDNLISALSQANADSIKIQDSLKTIKKNQFYLSKDQCNIINDYIKKSPNKSLFMSENKIINFKPNPHMDLSLFFIK